MKSRRRIGLSVFLVGWAKARFTCTSSPNCTTQRRAHHRNLCEIGGQNRSCVVCLLLSLGRRFYPPYKSCCNSSGPDGQIESPAVESMRPPRSPSRQCETIHDRCHP